MWKWKIWDLVLSERRGLHDVQEKTKLELEEASWKWVGAWEIEQGKDLQTEAHGLRRWKWEIKKEGAFCPCGFLCVGKRSKRECSNKSQADTLHAKALLARLTKFFKLMGQAFYRTVGSVVNVDRVPTLLLTPLTKMSIALLPLFELISENCLGSKWEVDKTLDEKEIWTYKKKVPKWRLAWDSVEKRKESVTASPSKPSTSLHELPKTRSPKKAHGRKVVKAAWTRMEAAAHLKEICNATKRV